MRRAAALLGIAGCAAQPHVTLRAPAPGASAAERVAAYEALGASDPSPDAPVLVLGSDAIIYYPADLIPVVPTGSATARAAERHHDLQGAAFPWQVAGAILAITGLGLATYYSVTQDGLARPAFGLGLAFAGTGLAGIPTIYYDARAEAERISAFTSYDADLKKRLDVCVEGTKIVACP